MKKETRDRMILAMNTDGRSEKVRLFALKTAAKNGTCGASDLHAEFPSWPTNFIFSSLTADIAGGALCQLVPGRETTIKILPHGQKCLKAGRTPFAGLTFGRPEGATHGHRFDDDVLARSAVARNVAKQLNKTLADSVMLDTVNIKKLAVSKTTRGKAKTITAKTKKTQRKARRVAGV